MTTPRILIFAASTRAGSLNQKLATLLANRIQASGGATHSIDLKDYDLPIYSGDIESGSGVPQAAKALHQQFSDSDGILIVSPEYNASAPPILVNVVAWLSRVGGADGIAAAFKRPHFGLASASPGAYGGYRGLMAVRNLLALQLGARILPAMLAVGAGANAFDDSGDLREQRLKDISDGLVKELVRAAASESGRQP